MSAAIAAATLMVALIDRMQTRQQLSAPVAVPSLLMPFVGTAVL
jgi:hypothetical protein